MSVASQSAVGASEWLANQLFVLRRPTKASFDVTKAVITSFLTQLWTRLIAELKPIDLPAHMIVLVNYVPGAVLAPNFEKLRAHFSKAVGYSDYITPAAKVACLLFHTNHTSLLVYPSLPHYQLFRLLPLCFSGQSVVYTQESPAGGGCCCCCTFQWRSL